MLKNPYKITIPDALKAINGIRLEGNKVILATAMLSSYDVWTKSWKSVLDEGPKAFSQKFETVVHQAGSRWLLFLIRMKQLYILEETTRMAKEHEQALMRAESLAAAKNYKRESAKQAFIENYVKEVDLKAMERLVYHSQYFPKDIEQVGFDESFGALGDSRRMLRLDSDHIAHSAASVYEQCMKKRSLLSKAKDIMITYTFDNLDSAAEPREQFLNLEFKFDEATEKELENSSREFQGGLADAFSKGLLTESDIIGG